MVKNDLKVHETESKHAFAAIVCVCVCAGCPSHFYATHTLSIEKSIDTNFLFPFQNVFNIERKAITCLFVF